MGIMLDNTTGQRVFSEISHSPLSPWLHSGTASYSPCFTLISSQNPIKGCLKLSTPLPFPHCSYSLVDWSKPMLRQVGALGSHYYEWVSSPSDLLEALSVTSWYLVPIFWVPVILTVFACGLADNSEFISLDYLQILWSVPCCLLGVLCWSLLEYSIHRWVFHMKPPDNSVTLITLHFLLHGLHHKVPFDSGRLLFPPVLAAAIAYILYSLLKFLFPLWMVHYVTAGTIIGYVSYDMMHYYLHYGSPEGNTHLYNMKRYHNQHHFAHHESGRNGDETRVYTSTLGTAPILRLEHVLLLSKATCHDAVTNITPLLQFDLPATPGRQQSHTIPLLESDAPPTRWSIHCIHDVRDGLHILSPRNYVASTAEIRIQSPMHDVTKPTPKRAEPASSSPF
ncbi:hypothetical protein PR048_029472 [Dryococelus australis]|uniref:Fatty acid hydroxylase domain-containing protein n=1 Tax=Dryococelus australis TaxID=614101 RepID=A0ABQ9GDG0_9NEOP|nr:hypothetical protein PR048_029472 [Dryococelus australis]